MALGFDGGLTCALGVTDLDRSIAWYRDVLGFDLLYRLEDNAWCELKTGVERVNVGLSQVEEAGGRGGATLTFGVEDIEAAKAELDSRGVRQDGPVRDIPGLVRLLTFYDPDDNALMLYEDLQQG
ncbi:MAG TPA: VOC family protein [Allosphingosinicella sp.]|jgi:catechol 2,3-dioxygenase-like lactoylglutathione lyase family enzyme